MNFSPTNPIVRQCIQAMRLEEAGDVEGAAEMFLQAWNEATNDHEKLLVAHHLSRQQQTAADQLKWLKSALALAQRVDDASVRAAFPLLYSSIADCHERLNDPGGRKYRELADSFDGQPLDGGPFYHGTRADLQLGELLSAGNRSNYQSDVVMNHIYFTALVDGAGLAAALSGGETPERVYVVDPTGEFEDDPNVTNKRFLGNPTRSYRSEAPLKIVGEVTEWERPAPDVLARLASVGGKPIIN